MDNTLLDLKNSSCPTQPHSIIAKYVQPNESHACQFHTRCNEYMQWVPEGRDRKLHHKSERKLKPTLIQIIPMWPLKQKLSLRFAVMARIAVRAVVTLQSLLGNASWIDTDLFLLLYSHLCFRYYHSIINSIDTQIFIQYLKFFISPSFPKKKRLDLIFTDTQTNNLRSQDMLWYLPGE